MVRLILSFILTAALTGSAAAQSTWYVDPTSGNNGNTGSSPGDAFLSITHALGSNPLLASGDTIVLNGGVYNSADGLDASGNQSEVFPLELPNGVSLVSGDLFSDPVIDGENVGVNAGALIDVAESIDSVTEVRGITFENCISPFVSATVNSIRGLLVDSCIFRGYDGAGILLQLSGGRVDDSFAIANCSFTGNSSGGNVGVLVFVADNTELDGGSIQNCTISNVAQGIWIETGLLATVSRDFTVTRNTISNFLAAGVQLRANIGDSTNSTTVRGNTVVGDGIGATNEVGLDVLITNALGAVSPSVVDGLVAFNDFSLANTNIMLRTTGADVGSTRIESVFAGNVIRNAVEYGVRFASFIDDGGMAPDFGGKVGGGANSGRNTFENPTATWEVGLDDIFTVPIAMAENFWIDGVNPASRTEISGGNFPSFLPVISNNLVGSLSSGVIQAEQADVLTISLSSGRFVVQVNEAFVPDVLASIGEFGQYKAFGISGPDGNVSVEPIDLQLVAVDGTELSFNVPGLTAGNYTITFTNPGFQSLASLGLRVTSSEGSGGDGGGGGCVVATAAHGDYNAPEVRILRKFRDRYLLPYAGGRSAVRAYYKHGGPAAVWIAERDWAKSAMRATLAVPTGVAWSLLYWNPGQRLLIAVLLLGGSFAMLRRRP